MKDNDLTDIEKKQSIKEKTTMANFKLTQTGEQIQADHGRRLRCIT